MTESGKSHGETEAPKNSDEEDIIAGSEGCLKVHMERRDSGWLQITPNLTKGWGKGGTGRHHWVSLLFAAWVLTRRSEVPMCPRQKMCAAP